MSGILNKYIRKFFKDLCINVCRHLVEGFEREREREDEIEKFVKM